MTQEEFNKAGEELRKFFQTNVYLDSQVPTIQEYLRNRRIRREFASISEPTPYETTTNPPTS